MEWILLQRQQLTIGFIGTVAEAAAAGTCVRASVPLARDVTVEAAIAAGVEMLQAEGRLVGPEGGVAVESLMDVRLTKTRGFLEPSLCFTQ